MLENFDHHFVIATNSINTIPTIRIIRHFLWIASMAKTYIKKSCWFFLCRIKMYRSAISGWLYIIASMKIEEKIIA